MPQAVDPAYTSPPFARATDDEAFELGKIAGYDEAMREVARVYEMQCPVERDYFPKGAQGNGSFMAHRWWELCLGAVLEGRPAPRQTPDGTSA